jgi:sulfate permease, SulP family
MVRAPRRTATSSDLGVRTADPLRSVSVRWDRANREVRSATGEERAVTDVRARPPDPNGPADLALAVLGGVVTGGFVVVLAVSFGVLVFSLPTPDRVADGIAVVLASSAVVAAVNAARSSFPGTVAGTQDNTTIVLAILAGTVAASASPDLGQDELFATIVVAVGLATALTGAALVLLGRFRLGRLIRYLPYPVIGGFLAGTGWLLLVGGLEVLLGAELSIATLDQLWQSGAPLRWVPAVAGALVLVALLRRVSSPLLLPAGLLVAVVAFYAALVVTGTSLTAARDDGWMLGPFPAASWPPVRPAELAGVDLGLVALQAPTIGSLVVIAVLALLLNASGVEVAVGQEVDLDRELVVSGTANLLAGLVGGTVGYTYTSLTVLAQRMGAARRLTGVVVALVCAGTLVVGFTAVTLVPVPIVGGLLALLGFAFLADWIVDGRRTLPRSDHAVVVVIMLAIATIGLLPGIAVGLALAVVLFVVRSSRVAVVKHVLDGICFRSNVERHPSERRALRALGDRLLVLELQGFVFFGTATGVLRVVERHRGQRSGGYVVLDLRRTSGIDSSAVFSFQRLARRLTTDGATLVLTGVRPDVQRHLEQSGLACGPEGVAVFADLDHGVEWCEEQLLAEAGAVVDATEPVDAAVALGGHAQDLGPCLEHRSFAAGDRLIEQGRPTEGLFVVTSGRVSVVLAGGDGRSTRLRTLRPGAIVGEVGFLLDAPATTHVDAETDGTLAVLTRERLQMIARDDPDLASALHLSLAQLLSRRFAGANRTIDALLD